MIDKAGEGGGKKFPSIFQYRPPVLYAICSLFLIFIFLIDLFIPQGVAVGVLYSAVILFSLWLPHKRATLGCAVVSSILIVVPFFYESPVVEMWKVVFNRGISIFIVWAIALLGMKRKEMEEQRNRMLLEREKALQEVKTLRGLLPICASCKKIKNNNGDWVQIESYIQQHSEAEFTHGLCPHCAERLYPDFFNKQDFPRKQ